MTCVNFLPYFSSMWVTISQMFVGSYNIITDFSHFHDFFIIATPFLCCCCVDGQCIVRKCFVVAQMLAN